MRFTFHILIFCLIPVAALSQQIDYNQSKGYTANGYDVVEYFNGNAIEGKSDFTTTYQGAKLRFSSKANLDTFQSAPGKFMPQYGGWCAYAMGVGNGKVTIDPETFEIRDGKLFLFYNRFFNNTLESWIEEGPEKLKRQADTNWEKLKFKR